MSISNSEQLTEELHYIPYYINGLISLVFVRGLVVSRFDILFRYGYDTLMQVEGFKQMFDNNCLDFGVGKT